MRIGNSASTTELPHRFINVDLRSFMAKLVVNFKLNVLHTILKNRMCKLGFERSILWLTGHRSSRQAMTAFYYSFFVTLFNDDVFYQQLDNLVSRVWPIQLPQHITGWVGHHCYGVPGIRSHLHRASQRLRIADHWRPARTAGSCTSCWYVQLLNNVRKLDGGLSQGLTWRATSTSYRLG